MRSKRRAVRPGATARIVACAMAVVLAVLHFPVLAGCIDSANLAGDTEQHDPCHDARLAGDDDACAHQIEPDPIVAPDACLPVGVSAGVPAAAPTYRLIPRRRSADASSRRPPPLAARPVSLFLLHLQLLN